MRFPCLDTVETEKKNRRETRREDKRAAATMKGAIEATEQPQKRVLVEIIIKTFYRKKNCAFFILDEETQDEK